jgi:hypothetical protein
MSHDLLDDTNNCPLADRCEGCGSTHDLAIVTVETMVGVHCMTICSADRIRPLPKRSLVGAVHRALEHCGHLGIDADEMAHLMDEEETNKWGTGSWSSRKFCRYPECECDADYPCGEQSDWTPDPIDRSPGCADPDHCVAHG